MCDDDDEGGGMAVPSIGAGAVLSEVRRLSGDVRRLSGDIVRKASDAARKLSGSSDRRRSSAHELLDDDADDDERMGDSSASLGMKVMAALCFGIALMMLTLGLYVQSAVATQAQAGDSAAAAAAVTAAAAAGATAAAAASPSPSSLTHQHITEQQRAQHSRGEAAHISCKSAANMHLISELAVGASCNVLCHSGCSRMDWVLLHEHVVWGDNATTGYADASLLCLAAQHATGEDGGEFTITIKAGAKEYPAVEAHGISSSAFEGEHRRAFVVALHKTAAQVAEENAAAAQRLRAQVAEVKPSELRAHFQTALDTVPKKMVALRFFGYAVGPAPRTAVLGDYERLDASQTGKVSKQQFIALPGSAAVSGGAGAAAASPAAAAATDSAGAAAASGQAGGALGERWAKIELKSFDAMDSDSDGLLDIEEFQRGYNGFERALSKTITQADLDNDHKISYSEMLKIGPEQALQLLNFHTFVSVVKDLEKMEL
jgi:hypothetical protein